MLIAQRIERMTATYNDSRRTVGQFLLNEGARLGQYTMQQVADVTFTSKATLVRVGKHLGFSGWQDLAAAYAAECEQAEKNGPGVDPNRPFKAGDSAKTIAENICRLHMESAWQTLELLDPHDLARAADILARAHRVALFGLSINELLLKQFQRKLFTVGKPVLFVSQAEYGLQVEMLGPDDCAIVISYTGDNPERAPMRQACQLRERGVPIVAITSAGDNDLRRLANCTLTMLSQERLFSKVATFSTEESISFLLDALFSCYFEKHYEENLSYKIGVSQRAEVNRRADHDRLWE